MSVRLLFNSYVKGNFAELLACTLLIMKGYRILARRYKTSVGEIDIVARRGKYLAAVEVKYRPSIDEAKSCISRSQQRRIIQATQLFLQDRKMPNMFIRFDIMAITSKKLPVHIQNAWQSDF